MKLRHAQVGDEGGFSLILTLISLMLLIAILKPLIFEVQREAQVTRNDRAWHHLRIAALEAFAEAEEVLIQDATQASGTGMDLGGLDVGASAEGAIGGEGAPGEEAQEDPPHDSFNGDSLRYHRKEFDKEENDDNVANWVIGESPNSESYERDEIRVKTFVYIEDENRKFNVLQIAHSDLETRDRAVEQLVRILEWVRDDRGKYNLPSDFDPDQLAEAFQEWILLRGGGSAARSLRGRDSFARPALLSNVDADDIQGNPDLEAQRDTALPLSLDELRQAVSDTIDVPESIWFDVVSDTEKHLHPGLGSLLTVYTALREQPIEEDDLGNWIREDEGGPTRADSRTNRNRRPASTPTETAEDAVALINVNTAPYAVLRGLVGRDKIGDAVIREIIEYRNEIDEEAVERMREEQMAETQDATARSRTDIATDMQGDEYQPRQAFKTLEDLEKVESFQVLGDAEKQEFLQYLTVTSEVFSIWVTTTTNPNEEAQDADPTARDEFSYEERFLDIRPGEIVRRFRRVVWRRPSTTGEGEVELVPIVPMEERTERKLAVQEGTKGDRKF